MQKCSEMNDYLFIFHTLIIIDHVFISLFDANMKPELYTYQSYDMLPVCLAVYTKEPYTRANCIYIYIYMCICKLAGSYLHIYLNKSSHVFIIATLSKGYFLQSSEPLVQ